jgi:hypothetical protein
MISLRSVLIIIIIVNLAFITFSFDTTVNLSLCIVYLIERVKKK